MVGPGTRSKQSKPVWAAEQMTQDLMGGQQSWADRAPRSIPSHQAHRSSWRQVSARDRTNSPATTASGTPTRAMTLNHTGSGVGSRELHEKIYCDKWIHDGTCAFIQQGCKYKHEMPNDRETQEHLGLFDGYNQTSSAVKGPPSDPPSPSPSA